MTAPIHPWVQTSTGIAFNLLAPEPSMVNFRVDIAPALARTARFCGHVASGPYSVAQHSVEGADALLRETGDKRLAALFLLHDAHEAYIGDMTTPVKWALEALARSESGESAATLVRTTLGALQHQIDLAIHAAAGIAPPNDAEAVILKAMDLRMLITERNHLLGPSPYPWATVIEAARPVSRRGALRVLPWPDAADEYMARAERWLPVFTKRKHLAA